MTHGAKPDPKRTVRVGTAVNRILWPRLRALGFFLAEGRAWKDGVSVKRSGPTGRGQGLLMGRHKFGGRFGVIAARERTDGTWDYLDLAKAGYGITLTYDSQSGAEAVMQQIAQAIELHVVPWLDGADSTKGGRT